MAGENANDRCSQLFSPFDPGLGQRDLFRSFCGIGVTEIVTDGCARDIQALAESVRLEVMEKFIRKRIRKIIAGQLSPLEAKAGIEVSV